MSVSKEVISISSEEKKSLFNLVHLSHQIQKGLVESMGELTPEVERAISILHERMPEKADAYKFFIDDLKAQADLWNEKASTFSRVAKAFVNYSERLKYSLKMACMELGVEELIGHDYKWKVVNNAASLVVDDESLLPDEYIEIVQSRKVRSDAIKQALKDGKVVPGARLETGSHVRVFVNNVKRK